MEQLSQFDPQRLIELVSTGSTALDGAMSPQTVRLLEKFGATKVDMTLWWAMTPQSWTCPACGRSKPELVRLNKNGDLMCRLVEHHDHMGDALQTQFRKHSIGRDKVVATELAEEFAKRSAAMVSAHDKTIICNDCNNADPKAKKIAEAPGEFTFSPAEIRQFIIVRANEAHEVIPDEAKRVWASCVPSFNLRMKIIDRIAEIAASNEHWFQRSPLESRSAHIESGAKTSARAMGYLGSLDVLCARDEPLSSKASAWRTTTHPRPWQRPSANEIDHIARVSCVMLWNRVPDDWVCPGCRREKIHTIRKKSKSNHWTFPLAQILFFDAHRTKRPKSQAVCADCADVAKLLGKEAVLTSGTDNHLYACHVMLSEVSAVVVPQKHGRHNINRDTVTQVLDGIVERLIQQECDGS